MKSNYTDTQINRDSLSVAAQARLLMSGHRHKIQHRQQSMLQRVSSEVGIEH